ncbi:hypothetical protein LCGC14_1620150 [marine sediment metagenome]|uniref:Uncharacterized protein n=1 Tax=marine sediment metagenome TaxID=412755 RepID=A0A0F9KL99_9ZZZZ
MAIVIERDGVQYLCTFSKPETQWILDLAQGMGITKEAIVGAAMNHGLTYYVQTFTENEITDRIKDLTQEEIDKPTGDTKDKPSEKIIDDNACDDLC